MTQTRIPVEDFLRRPEREAAELSQDGRFLAWLAPWEQRLNLHVRDRQTGEERRVTSASARDITQYFWASFDRLAFLQDTNGDENWHVWSVGADGRDERCLTPVGGLQARLISDRPESDDEILVALNERDPRLHDAWRINVRTGARTMVADNPGTVVRWLADHEGRVRVAAAVDGLQNKILTRDTESSPWRTLLAFGALDEVRPLVFTADNNAIYAASNLARGATAIVEIALATGVETRVLAERADLDLDELHSSVGRRVPTHVTVNGDRPSFLFLDPTVEAIQRTIDERLPGRVNRLTTSSRDERVWTVHSSSDCCPGEQWLFDAEHGTLEHLWDVMPWIPVDQMCPMEPVSFDAESY